MSKTIKDLKHFHDKAWITLENYYENEELDPIEIQKLKDAYYESAIITLKVIKKGRQ